MFVMMMMVDVHVEHPVGHAPPLPLNPECTLWPSLRLHPHDTTCMCSFCVCRVTPRPYILVGHFYAVAIFGMYHIMRSAFPWQLHKGAFRALMVIWKACTVMLPLIGSELKNTFQF